MSLKNKWIICRGPHADDSLIVASVNKELFTMHHGVQAKLPGSDDVEYSLRAKGYIVGRREVDILHRGQAIGHVSLLQFAYSTAKLHFLQAERPVTPVVQQIKFADLSVDQCTQHGKRRSTASRSM